MQFKHPEILYFLFLLVIPILVHLFQLRRFKKEYFTNIQLLKELSIQTRKSSTIKKWLLLATRLLLLAAIVIAFAQPFFKSKDNKNSTNQMYIVLDNSYSMQSKGQKGELLKRAIEDLLEHTPENQNFSLITNNLSYWNTDIKSIRKELQQLDYSPFPFQLESAMAKIKSHKSIYNKDVIIISDAVGLEQKQLKSIDKDFNTFFIIPIAEQKKNVSIDRVFINQTLDDFFELSVQISAFGIEKKDIPITLTNRSKLIAKTIISLDAKEKIINFTIPKTDFNGNITIADNALDYDNTLYFSISEPEKNKVLSIGESEKSEFLSRVYTNDEFEYNNFNLIDLDYNIIEKQDAIVLNELIEIPQALQTTLKSFVEKGGNLILIPSKENSISNLNSFLLNFGKIQFNASVNSEKLITKIAFNNPIYMTVFEKQITNFQYPNTKYSFAISSTNPPILSYEDQSIFLTSIQNQLSSVYVFAAPINKSNSNFQNSPLIVPTFYNMAQSLQKTGISAMVIGEKNTQLIDALLSKDEIVYVKNMMDLVSNEKFIPIQQILNNKVKINCDDNPQKAGNFGVFKKEKLLKEISFNYNRSESNLNQTNENLLSEYKKINTIVTVFDTLKSDRTDNEIWKWFVILTFLLLVTELLLQKFVK